MSYPVVGSCQVPDLAGKLEQYLGYTEKGRFVDVGAFDGVHWSNTFGLAQIGWKGLCYEPLPEAYELCRRAHREHDVRVMETAITDRNGQVKLWTGSAGSTTREEMIPLMNSIGGSLDPERYIWVASARLDYALWLQRWEPDFELLSIDTEGGEWNVMAGFDPGRWRPKVIIIELAEQHPSLPPHFGAGAISTKLDYYGYRKVFADRTNTIFVHQPG